MIERSGMLKISLVFKGGGGEIDIRGGGECPPPRPPPKYTPECVQL